jgi:hypothetical protein
MERYLHPGATVGKADQLISLGAVEIPGPPDSLSDIPEESALICVVSNGPFDAAAYAFSDRELEAFILPDDHRPKRWLLMEKTYVEEHAK